MSGRHLSDTGLLGKLCINDGLFYERRGSVAQAALQGRAQAAVAQAALQGTQAEEERPHYRKPGPPWRMAPVEGVAQAALQGAQAAMAQAATQGALVNTERAAPQETRAYVAHGYLQGASAGRATRGTGRHGAGRSAARVKGA